MDETGADRRAEMPEDFRKVAGGAGEKKERERQASTAGTEETRPEGMRLLDIFSIQIFTLTKSIRRDWSH